MNADVLEGEASRNQATLPRLPRYHDEERSFATHLHRYCGESGRILRVTFASAAGARERGAFAL